MRLTRSLLKFSPALVSAQAAMPVRAEEGIKAGMPQLDIQYFPGQVFWLAITFAALYVLMSRYALPGVERVQNNRRAVIAKNLAAAQTANDAAKRTIAEYEKILIDARSKAISAEDMTAATKESMEKQAEQQKVLTKNMQQAEARIAKARDEALVEVRRASVEIANSILEKITGMKMQVKS